MSRRFAFRIWDIGAQRLALGSFSECLRWNLQAEVEERQENYHIMQFTGLVDSKGQEIYEGDIVIWSESPESPHYIGFDQGSFTIRPWIDGVPDPTPCDSLFCLEPDSLTVIGHIYEDPGTIRERAAALAQDLEGCP